MPQKKQFQGKEPTKHFRKQTNDKNKTHKNEEWETKIAKCNTDRNLMCETS